MSNCKKEDISSDDLLRQCSFCNLKISNQFLFKCPRCNNQLSLASLCNGCLHNTSCHIDNNPNKERMFNSKEILKTID